MRTIAPRARYPPPVYQLLLTRRYLLSKIMPLLAAAAVMLCTALILVSWSVMGGFLTTLIGSGRTLVGDVAVTWPTTGFPHYDDLIARLEKDPLVAAAAPVVETYGLLGLPDGRRNPINVRAIDKRFARVAEYEKTLYWHALDKPLPKDTKSEDVRVDPKLAGLMNRLHEQGLNMVHIDPATGTRRPAMVLGCEVSGFNQRQREGFYVPYTRIRRQTSSGLAPEQTIFMPDDGEVTLSLVPLDDSGRAVEMATSTFPVANEFQSGVYEADEKVVFAPLAEVQKMLKMNQVARVKKTAGDPVDFAPSPDGGKETLKQSAETVGVTPARVTTVYVRGKGDTTADEAEALKHAVERVYDDFAADHHGEVPETFRIRILSWADQNRGMIMAVKKETALVLTLFGMISLVSAFLILAIFWAMISEKTKDIGILRAMGASRAGVAGLWIAYGTALGVVGSALGMALAYVVVTNINPIHEWLGAQLGIVIWDPRIYYFTIIPNQVRGEHALWVFLSGVVCASIGAIIPAVRAAIMHPVKALRFE